jgi:hypothetical protein
VKLKIGLCLAAFFVAGNAVAQGTTRPTDPIETIARASSCRSDSQAPSAYVAGLALTFARALCQPDRPDVKVISSAAGDPSTPRGKSDGLTIFDPTFERLGMHNNIDGVDSLRHTYVLLLALGLVESSGRYCVGRDTTENFTKADSAEAGLLQTSFGAREFNSTLEPMFRSYQGQHDPARCMFDVFSQNIRCSKADAGNFGDPSSDGFQWQALTKQCPAFSAEYGAVVLRTHGGFRSNGEFGPINCFVHPFLQKSGRWCDKPTLRSSCDVMFTKVQDFVSKSPSICDAVK